MAGTTRAARQPIRLHRAFAENVDLLGKMAFLIIAIMRYTPELASAFCLNGRRQRGIRR
jgi:hypothetical protein